MAQVNAPETPSVSPDVQQPDDYLRVAANPNAFGANIGEALQGAALDVGHTLVSLQSLQDETDATTKSAGYAAAAIPLREQFYGLKGQAAVDAAPAYQKSLLDLRDQTIAAAGNPLTQKLVSQDMQRQTAYALNDIAPFVIKQTEAASIDASTGRASVMANSAVGVRNDPTQVASMAMAGAGEIQKMGEIQGWDPDTIAAKQATYLGATYQKVIGTLALEDPARANAMFQSVQGQLDGASQMRIAEELKPKLLESQSTSIANAIGGNGGTSGSAGSAGFANNPLNLRVSNAAWDGKGQPYNGFETFATPEQGVRAAVLNLKTIANKNGGQITLQNLVNIWNPKGDGNNDPTAYAAAVSKSSGIGLNDNIPLDDPARTAKLVRAMAQSEDGAKNAQLTDSAIATGVQSALTGAPAGQGANAAPAPAFQAPDLNDQITQARQMAGGNPELEQHAVAKVVQNYHLWESSTASQRAQLGRSLGDTAAALADGRTDVSIPEQQIRSLYPKEQADDMVNKLQEQQQLGLITSSVKFASPDALTSMRAQLANGIGAPEGAGKNAPGGAGPTQLAQYAMRDKKLAQFDQTVALRTKALQDDPAAYTMQSPNVSAAFSAYQANPNDASAAQTYATATLAEQARLGVPEGQRTILTKPQAVKMAQSIQTLDPSKGSATAQLNGLENQYGALYPQVFKSMVTDGKLDPEYSVMGSMNAPGQITAQTDFQRMLQFKSEKGGQQGLSQAVPGDMRKKIDDGLPDALDAFRQTTMSQSAGLQLFDSVQNSVKNLAYYYAATGTAKDDQSAVQMAADGVLNQHYDFRGSMRTPKGLGDAFVNAANATQSSLNADDLSGTYLPRFGLAANDKTSMLTAAQAGQWVPNANDDGGVLMGKFGSTYLPMRRKDGSMIELKFNAVQNANTPPAAPAPASLATVNGAIQ